MDDKTRKNEVCFVVSPIGAGNSEARIHADWVLEFIIKPAFEGVPDFRVERADDISTPGQINTQVIDRLLKCRLVIADLSLLNANVFYEIGIRHMAELPIIHLQREDDALPFDVAGFRAVKFSLKEARGIKAAQKQLASMIKDVLDPDYQVNNPVIEARGRAKLKESATPEQQILLEDMASMKSRLAYLEAQQSLHSMMIDPTISIPNRGSWEPHLMREFAQGARQVVLRNPPSWDKKPKVVVDVAGTGAARDKILELLIDETKNYPGVSIDQDDKQVIEVSGDKNDMRRLYEILRGHIQIGGNNVLLIGD